MKKRAFKIIDLTNGQHSPLIITTIEEMNKYLAMWDPDEVSLSEHGIIHIADVDTIEQPDGVDEDEALEFNVQFIPFCTVAGFMKMMENHSHD